MLIVLHGPDTYRSRLALSEIKEKFKREVDPLGSNIVSFDAESDDASALHSALFMSSFFARKRLVIIQNSLRAEASLKPLLETELPRAAELDDHIIVCWEDQEISRLRSRQAVRGKKLKAPKKTATPDNKKNLAKFLLAGPYVKLFTEPQGVTLLSWILEEARRTNAALDRDAASELAARTGSDLWRLHNELAKLSSLTGGKITKRDVQQNVSGKSDDPIFAIVEELLRGNIQSSVNTAFSLIDNGMSFQEFFAVISGQMRNMWEAKAGYVREGIHPFAHRKALEAGSKFTPEKTARLLNLFVRIDTDAKTTNQPPHLLAQRLILGISDLLKT